MDLRKAREEERRQDTERRKQAMVTAATSCFCKHGIEYTSIADIAREAGFGEATIYRYFFTKENLALECGIAFWHQAWDFFQNKICMDGYAQKSGMQQAEVLMRGAIEFYQEKKDIFRFIYYLDSAVLSNRAHNETKLKYEQSVDSLRPFLLKALEKGKIDGSVARSETALELYYTLTNGIFSMMQKQSAAPELLETDKTVDGMRKMELLVDLLISALRR